MDINQARKVVPIGRSYFVEKLIEKLKDCAEEYIDSFDGLLNEINGLFKSPCIYFENRDLIFLPSLQMIIPDIETFKLSTVIVKDLFDFEKYLSENQFVHGTKTDLIKLSELKRLKSLMPDYFNDKGNYLCSWDDRSRTTNNGSFCAYNLSTAASSLVDREHMPAEAVTVFTVARLPESINGYLEFLFNVVVRYGLLPRGISRESEIKLKDLSQMAQIGKEYIYLEENRFTYDCELMIEDSFDERYKEVFDKISWRVTEIRDKYLLDKNIGEVNMDIKERLLNCEKVRADIEPYDERILTDPNRGHWDLWMDEDSESFTAINNEELMARNPRADVNENGVIAIDFGTKSTIVVYQNDIEHSLPMGIGDGNLSKGPTQKRYENPTIMQFVDLKSFLEAYNLKEGRPETVWENLPISHTAYDKLVTSKSEEYYAFLYQIKQWAGLREKQFRIKDIKDNTYTLPSFLELKEGDFNPIEIYAYYIGLYINNMRKGHGIFLDYYLSFPVTYEIKIRKKIVESFEKGLKKSLPIHILKDEELMKSFRVNGDISEPAAYAVCALQEYGFDPEDEEEIFYSIFDFGGGTTDFDFGLWRRSKKRRFDYTIENFGAGGDEYLGGENLLEMLAFEIFKSNQELMRNKQFYFSLAPKCKEFLGSDALLSDSQEAEKNMHNLMEVLRPYWEKNSSKEDNILKNCQVENIGLDYISDYITALLDKHSKMSNMESFVQRLKKIEMELEDLDEDDMDEVITAAEKVYELEMSYFRGKATDGEMTAADVDTLDNGYLTVSLFDKEGSLHPGIQLYASREMIDNFFEEKIAEGVDNFFAALLLSYQNDKVKKPTKVNILLAGNSCKSPIVKKVFEYKIEEQKRNIRSKIDIQGDVGNLFEIFPPLGTREAYKKMNERNIQCSENDFEKPTGKTGVAFGLLQCREGGTIERISNISSSSEIPFQYFLGWQSRKKFLLFKDDSKITKYKGKPNYNEWYKFIEADEKTFYIYYTTLPECVNGNLPISEVKMKKCTIDCVDDNAFVYIRATSPHSLEYVVSQSDNVDKDKLCEATIIELG